MGCSFDEALCVAKAQYPHAINHYEEYENYYAFDYDDGAFRCGGYLSPIVVRKSDLATFNYEAIFFNMDEHAEDVGEVLSEGAVG